MEKIQFHEKDEVGEGTLDVINKADKFNYWMYKTIKPFCSGKILEIGSGVGNISQFFLEEDQNIMLSDIRQGYCERLKENYSSYRNLIDTRVIDLTDPDFEVKFKDLLGSFDTVFSLNVVEHIYDDNKAIENCRKLLKEGGNLIILVPSYQSLFCNFDKELEHYRRYNLKSLSRLFVNNNFTIVKRTYFNFVGIFGWFFSGKILRKKSIPEGQMGLYNKLVPFFKVVDKLVFHLMGLSTIVVGEK